MNYPQLLSREELDRTDYLLLHLQSDKIAQYEIFRQMLLVLEMNGACRNVYHKLERVLFPVTEN